MPPVGWGLAGGQGGQGPGREAGARPGGAQHHGEREGRPSGGSHRKGLIYLPPGVEGSRQPELGRDCTWPVDGLLR